MLCVLSTTMARGLSLVSNLRLRPVPCFAAATLMVVFLFVSAPYTGGLFTPPLDKLAHVGFFGCVTLLLAIGLGKSRIHIAFIAAVCAGIADESYQALLPARHADWGDLLTDIVAAGCAALLAHHFRKSTSPELPIAGTDDPEPQ